MPVGIAEGSETIICHADLTIIEIITHILVPWGSRIDIYFNRDLRPLNKTAINGECSRRQQSIVK